jgi:ribose 1,5-bisphosphokinase
VTHDGGPRRIGPGRLVVVVGPSGAGKDTLMALAQTECGATAHVVFPRRVVTRPASAAEDHDSVSDHTFDARLRAGGFAFSWQAHGLKYGIPADVDFDLADGKTVVCNVSRGIVASLRERYARCCVVLVTAPKDVLMARLAGRQRTSDGDLTRRLDRSYAEAGTQADVVINNVGPPDQAAAILSDTIRGPRSVS